jgi:DNA-binding LacI/PurR family transcriptional regulator
MNGRRQPTLEDVAAVAGVSRATVSRVINSTRNVDPQLAQIVQAAVAETGYVPNQAARTLVTRRTDSVALVVSEGRHREFDPMLRARVFTDPFFGRVVAGSIGVLQPLGINLVLLVADDVESRGRLVGQLRQRHVDGVMLISTYFDDPLPALLTEARLPAVLSRRPSTPLAMSYVDTAQHAGGALAAGQLVARGCRRVATITGPLDVPAARERLAGFRDAMAHHGQADVPAVEGTFGFESGKVAMARLLDEHPDLDGVFVGNDLMANGALVVLADRGLPVPDQMAVVGFDDGSAALTARPPLTTVRQPVEDMAAEMARLLLATIERPDLPARSVIFEPTLVLRESA